MSPSLDVLSSTGDRTVGWMGMYDIFSRKFNSGPDIGFTGVGDVKCLEHLWSLSGQTPTVPSLYPNAKPPAMSCPPFPPTLHASPQSNNPQVTYDSHHCMRTVNHTSDRLVFPVMQVTGSLPKFAFTVPVSPRFLRIPPGPGMLIFLAF